MKQLLVFLVNLLATLILFTVVGGFLVIISLLLWDSKYADFVDDAFDVIWKK